MRFIVKMVLNVKSQVKAHLSYEAPTPSSQLALYRRGLDGPNFWRDPEARSYYTYAQYGYIIGLRPESF